MPCIDTITLSSRVRSHWAAVGSVALVALATGLAGCGSHPPAPSSAPAPASKANSSAAAPAAAPSAAPAPQVAGAKLPPPPVSKTWNEYKLNAAKRLVAANPSGSFTGKPQQMLLAVPVLDIELNADGSIKNIDVMRRPSQAQETVQMAIDAVKRAAPFGDVSKLPKPWRFAEAFLFNDDKRFKPRTLDAQ